MYVFLHKRFEQIIVYDLVKLRLRFEPLVSNFSESRSMKQYIFLYKESMNTYANIAQHL